MVVVVMVVVAMVVVMMMVMVVMVMVVMAMVMVMCFRAVGMVYLRFDDRIYLSMLESTIAISALTHPSPLTPHPSPLAQPEWSCARGCNRGWHCASVQFVTPLGTFNSGRRQFATPLGSFSSN